MYIKNIELENFRNYINEKIDFDKNLNIITGSNAQGKTSLLEGIYICSFGKSFRTSRDKEMINFGKDFFRIKSCFVKEEEEFIDFVLSKEGKKAAKINGCKIDKISEIISDYYVVVFSPDDLKIVKEDPEIRRNFIDRELCQIKISYYQSLLNYKKSLKQRNAYLKKESVDDSMLDVWDTQLAKEGTKIIHERMDFIENLGKISCDIHKSITEGVEETSFKYISSIEFIKNIKEQEEVFLEILRGERERDLYYKNTSRGPHKDDIDILIDNISIRKYGSQGQQRTAALSMKLAEIEVIKEQSGESPILLLDDVLSELDEDRQKYLIKYLNDVQVFITSAEIPNTIIKEFPKHKKINVEKGHFNILK